MENKKAIQLIAPAGDVQSLKLAIYYHADAVYLGIDKFNARLSADNFKLDNLSQWVGYCHIFGVKVFLTLNTIIKQAEFKDAVDIAYAAYNANVDALIVTDLGLINFLQKHLPQMPLHFSTQMNIHNQLGCTLAAKLGAKAIVVSRETSEDDILSMSKCGAELEAFVQGALCVSISGQCYLSSIADGNSGNRGLCKQPCRQYYTCIEKSKEINRGFLLSPKDLCAGRNDRLRKLIDCGVTKLKIEGRLRRPSYVAQSVKSYRKALDTDLTFNEKDFNELAVQFNRGNFTSGYDEDVISIDVQGHIGIKAGEAYRASKTAFTIKSDLILSKDDGFKLLREGKEIGTAVLSGNKKQEYFFESNCEVKDGDVLRLTTDSVINQELCSVSPKAVVDITFIANAGKPVSVKLSCMGKTVEKFGDIAESAINQPLEKGRIFQQLAKLPEPFCLGETIIEADGIFMPIANINKLRREGIIELINLLAPNLRQPQKNPIELTVEEKLFAKCENAEKLTILCVSEYIALEQIDWNLVDYTVINPFTFSIQTVEKMLSRIKMPKEKVLLHLPSFATNSDITILKQLIKDCSIQGVVADNLYGIMLGIDCNVGVFGGLGLNLANDYAVEQINALCSSQPFVLLSKELSFNDIKTISAHNKSFFTFGDFTVMSLRHCPGKLNLKTNCKTCAAKPLQYVDKGNRKFYLCPRKIKTCTWDVFNGLQLSAGLKGVKEINSHYISFLLQNNKANINNILAACKRVEDLETTDFTTTYGLYKRGVN